MKIKSLKDLTQFTKDFSKKLNQRSIILLNGPMGVGKTEFVKQLVETLMGEHANSPTFSIHQSYQIQNGILHHLDLYRLENENELLTTGIWDLLDSGSGIFCIEWANKFDNKIWPKSFDIYEINFEFEKDQKTRTLTLTLSKIN